MTESLIDPDHAGVGDGGARDVSAQILQRAGSGAGWLDMHSPVLAPDLGIDRPIVLLEQAVEVLAEGGLQVRQMQQELWLFDAHELALLVETGARHQAVKVRMELQFLGPGMQDGDKAIDLRTQGFVGGELFAQGPGGGGEEQVIGLFGARAEEAGAQLCRQREGDQEVRGIDQLAQFALHPAVCGLGAALRAGFVVAGVVGKMNVVARFAGKGTPAQCRSAAVSDRPDGAMLLRRERRSRFEQLRDKTAQRPQHGGGSAHEFLESFGLLARQSAAELVHQAQGVLAGLMGQVQIDHGGGDLFMAQELLDGVQMRAGFQEMGGKGMAQGVH